MVSATNGSQNNSAALNGTAYGGFHLFDSLNLEQHAALISIILAIVAILIERIIEYKKNKDATNEKITRIRTTIIKEIDNTNDTLNNVSYKPLENVEGQPIKGAILNTDAYESLLHSGLFTYFQPPTQNKLADFYIRIKLQNSLQRERILLRSHFLLTGRDESTWKSLIKKHDNLIRLYQENIKNTLNSIKDILNTDTGQL